MRVVTLLPAATEIVAALGDVTLLVGISHECDYPPSVQHLPRVTTTSIDVAAPGIRIDEEVQRLRQAGKPIIAADVGQLRRLAPDLLITQDICEVCAVSDGEIHRLAASLCPAPAVLSLRARDLAGIWSDIHTVGAALGLEDEAEELVAGLRSRLERLHRSRPNRLARVLCIEWLEPLYLAGHWVPELVAAAGGHDVGASPGSHSTRREWEEVSRLWPDHILIMLCGLGVDRASEELDRLTHPSALELLRSVPTWVIDGNSYTSRPGPRVVDGATRIRAAISHREKDGVQQWHAAGAC